METKKCSKCRQVKNVGEFYFHNARKNYWAACKKCSRKHCVDYNKTPRGRATKNFYKTRTRCRKIGREFSIKLHEYIEILNMETCYYCETVPTIKSVDRVDNNVGYRKENCVMSCLRCNSLKSSITKNDLEILRKIIAKLE